MFWHNWHLIITTVFVMSSFFFLEYMLLYSFFIEFFGQHCFFSWQNVKMFENPCKRASLTASCTYFERFNPANSCSKDSRWASVIVRYEQKKKGLQHKMENQGSSVHQSIYLTKLLQWATLWITIVLWKDHNQRGTTCLIVYYVISYPAHPCSIIIAKYCTYIFKK